MHFKPFDSLAYDAAGCPGSCSTTRIEDDETDSIELEYDALDLMSRYTPEETCEMIKSKSRIDTHGCTWRGSSYLHVGFGAVLFTVSMLVVLRAVERVVMPTGISDENFGVRKITTSASAEDVLQMASGTLTKPTRVWDIIQRSAVLLLKY